MAIPTTHSVFKRIYTMAVPVLVHINVMEGLSEEPMVEGDQLVFVPKVHRAHGAPVTISSFARSIIAFLNGVPIVEM